MVLYVKFKLSQIRTYGLPIYAPTAVHRILSMVSGMYIPPEELEIAIGCYRSEKPVIVRSRDEKGRVEERRVRQHSKKRWHTRCSYMCVLTEHGGRSIIKGESLLELYIRSSYAEELAIRLKYSECSYLKGNAFLRDVDKVRIYLRAVEFRELLWGLPERVDPGIYPLDVPLFPDARHVYLPVWRDPVKGRVTDFRWFMLVEQEGPYRPIRMNGCSSEEEHPVWVDPQEGRKMVAFLSLGSFRR